MFHTTLSQGKHIAQERDKSLFESKWKGQEQGILFKVQVERTEERLIRAQSVRDKRKYYRPRSKDRVANHLYVY